MSSTQTQPTAEQQRASALMALGFNATQAFLLAATREDGGHVAPSEAERLVRSGCSHELALRMLL